MTAAVELETVAGLNMAPAVLFTFNERTHMAATPEHAPLQPENALAAAGFADSVITVPDAAVIEHVAPHEIPAGDELMLPPPVPDVETLSVLMTVPIGARFVKRCSGAILSQLQC